METNVYSNLALYGSLVMAKDDSSFPVNPAIGTIIIKDQCIYAYIRIGGLETWYPFASKTNSYIHTQGLESDSWIVNHQLGTTDIWYQIKDATGNIVIAGKTDIDENSFELNFTSALVGTCIVVAPATIDVPTVKATSIDVGNGYVIIDNSGVLINGSYALTSAGIDAETSRAQAAESSLASSISAETTRASNAETTLSSNLLSEVTRATNAEATLTANLNSEVTRASNAESTLTANLNNEISRALAAEASLASAISNIGDIGNAFEYVGTVAGGAGTGSAYDLDLLATKDAGSYYKVATPGYFKIGSGGTPFYAKLNDGLVWNLSSGVDVIDNTNSEVSGTTNQISVTGTSDSGFVVAIDSAFVTRVSNLETSIDGGSF